MESELRDELRLADRAAAAPYVDQPPTPRWYPPVIGVWAAALTASFTLLDAHPILFACLVAVLAAAEGAFLAWLGKRQGALPSLRRGRPPAEIATLWRAYLVGFGVVVALVVAVSLLVHPLVGAAVALVTVTGGIAWYETKYSAAAAVVRERLG